MNSYRYNGARDIIFKHLPFNGDLEQSATNAAKIITEELRRRGASTCTLPYDASYVQEHRLRGVRQDQDGQSGFGNQELHGETMGSEQPAH